MTGAIHFQFHGKSYDLYKYPHISLYLEWPPPSPQAWAGRRGGRSLSSDKWGVGVGVILSGQNRCSSTGSPSSGMPYKDLYGITVVENKDPNFGRITRNKLK